MNCNIIKDLLPSYIDQICSIETATAIEEHIKQCQNCKGVLELMQQPPVKQIETNIAIAKEPFKRINKKRRFQVITAIIMTFLLTIISYQVVQNVGVVNNFFFPKVYAIVNIEDGMEDWQGIHFIDFHHNQQDYLMYGRFFGEKQIVNDANSESDVLLRIKDAKGEIIIDEILIPAGESIKFKDLKRGEKYYFEIKAPPGQVTINAV